MADQKSDRYSANIENKKFLVAGCQIESVVIYKDRAEVCRSLTCKLDTGEHEILVKELSTYVDPDSIRVEGKGPATIMEVAFQTNAKLDKDEENKSEIEALEEQKKGVEDSILLLSKKKSRYEKQKVFLDGAGNTVQSGGTKKKSEEGGTDFIQELKNYLSFYDEFATQLDEDLHKVNKEITKLTDEKKDIEESIRKLKTDKLSSVSRDMSVLLDVKENMEITLVFSYVVLKAKWTPKYDIRVFSNDNVLKLHYYGMITQSSGEDWLDAKISLSTAIPSVGGNPPSLGKMQLSFKGKDTVNAFSNILNQNFEPQMQSKQRATKLHLKEHPNINAIQQIASHPRGGVSSFQDEFWCDDTVEEFADYIDEDEAEISLDTAVTEVKDSVTTATFEISRQSTIPSDATEHKVTIALVDLQPSFKYQSGGLKATHAYLKAKVKNTSPYALLAGPANVFLDNNFISKTALRGVSPSEVFECSLGVDPAVKVMYQAVTKFREQSGFMSKATTLTYQRTVIVRNTRSTAVKIVVSDYLPISTEEKIKVNLVEPVLKQEKGKPGSVILNKQNNIEWDLEIPAGKSEELLVKYTVEHPAKQEISVKVIN